MGYPASMSKSDDDWRAESDLETLMAAERIKKDKPRYQKAMAIAKKKADDLKSVAGTAALSGNAPASTNPLRGDE